MVKVFSAYDLAIDYLTAFFLIYNIIVLSTVSIFFKAPLVLQQFFLIYNCSNISIVMINVLISWLVWVLLGLLVVWDLFAGIFFVLFF